MFKTISRRISHHENHLIELHQCIQEYHNHRTHLLSLINDTISIFRSVSDVLSDETLYSFDVNSLMILLSELGGNQINKDRAKKHDKLKIENPALVIIGQINSGKSKFLNRLLKKNLVPQRAEPCTDRITRVTYNENTYVKLIDDQGKRLEKKKFRNSPVPIRFIKLNEDKKKDPYETSQVVRVGTNAKLLKSGIDLIEYPVISENDNLAKLVQFLDNNYFPVVIYVIHGGKGVTQKDTADLVELKSLAPHVDIIYFITHLDTENPSEYGSNYDLIELAKMKMVKSFQKLQAHNFIPMSFTNWNDCPYFHGSSLDCLIDYDANKHTNESKYHFYLFCRFYSCLTAKLGAYFENKTLESCDILMNFQMNISTKIINYAQNFAQRTKENYEHISSIKQMEAEMYLQIKNSISDSKHELVHRLMERLERESDAIIGPITDTVYPASIMIPEDGIVDDPFIIDQCTKSIMKVFIQGLENILKGFVGDELFTNYRKAVDEKIFHSISARSIPKNGKAPYKRILERILNRKYKLERLSVAAPHSDQTVIVEFMNVVLSSIKTFLSNGLIDKLNGNQVNVKNSEWKLQQAGEYLRKCDHHLLAEDVCKSLLSDFKLKHVEFLKAMENETQNIEKKIHDSEKIRIEAAKITPIFFRSFLETMNIRDKYLFNELKEKELISTGPKSKVYECLVKNSPMAMKTVELDVYTLQNISEEIFYSQQLCHNHLLTPHGLSIHDDKKRINIFYPLKKTDLGRYMKNHGIIYSNAWEISLQIADVIKYLHEQGIIHRDLKLSNILIDDNEDITIADYGFCKSKALVEHLNERMPIYIAPEIIENNQFTKKSDIFAFGFIVWHLFEGTGSPPKDAIYLRSINQFVWEHFQVQFRHSLIPQKLKKIPEPMWNILESCWHPDLTHRPDIDQIITELQNCQNALSLKK